MSQRRILNEKPDRSVTPGEAITEGDLVAISPFDGKGYKACAASGNKRLPAFGVAEKSMDPAATTGYGGSKVTLKRVAQVYDDTVTLKPGSPVYVSNTPGAVSATAGDTSQIVGQACEDEHVYDIQIIPIAEQGDEGSNA